MNESNYYRELYKSNFPHKDKLDEVKRLIDWEVFSPILSGLFKDTLV